MADAMCGPSNALQSFQKHSQTDRTLQQDRLASRHSPSQGFRSSPGPNAGLLDPEFEAFQAGMPAGPPQFEAAPLPHLQHFAPPPVQAQLQPQSSMSGWADDFQRLNIGPAQPALAHQLPVPISQQAPAQIQNHNITTSWHTDFMQSQGMPVFESQPFMTAEPSWIRDTQMSMGYGPMTAIAQPQQPEIMQNTPFDIAAFERAFDAARLEMLEAEEPTLLTDDGELSDIEKELQEETDLLSAQAEAASQKNHDALLSGHAQYPDAFMVDQHRILDEASREIPSLLEDAAPAQQPQQEGGIDDDELAHVAGQLLDSVSHDTSDKFASSVFLNLMRRLRDREVRVDGEHFVETGTNSPIDMSARSSPIPEHEPTFGRTEKIAQALADLELEDEYMVDDSEEWAHGGLGISSSVEDTIQDGHPLHPSRVAAAMSEEGPFASQSGPASEHLYSSSATASDSASNTFAEVFWDRYISDF